MVAVMESVAERVRVIEQLQSGEFDGEIGDGVPLFTGLASGGTGVGRTSDKSGALPSGGALSAGPSTTGGGGGGGGAAVGTMEGPTAPQLST